MSTPDPTAPVPRHDPADPDPTTVIAPPGTSGPGDGGPQAADDYGLPEPPDRGAQHAFDAPPAAPPESEAYPWPTPASWADGPATDGPASDNPSTPPPPPPPSGWQPRPEPWPYVGGQPAPTPYESPTPYPYPAAGMPAGQASRPGAGPPPRPGAYGPPSGGYSTPTWAYAPYGYVAVDPFAKSRTVAGILGILIGGLGVHRFYLGYVGIGVLQIAVTLVTFGAGAIWGFVEGILYLTQRTGQYSVDATGRPLRE